MHNLRVYLVILMFACGLAFTAPTWDAYAMDETKTSQLRAELDADPMSLGYSSITSSVGKAAKLNEIGASNEFSDRGTVSTYEVAAAIEYSEFQALTATQQNSVNLLTSSGDGLVDINDANVWATFTSIFGEGSATLANLEVVSRTSISRADALDLGGRVYYWDVERAQNLVIP